MTAASVHATPSAVGATGTGQAGVLRVAMVGCGDVSAVHLPAIDAHPGVRLVAVVDPDDGRRNAAEAAYGAIGFASLTELLATARPDVVHLATPHHTHASLAREALAAGVHVLLEKPLARTRAEADELAAVAETAWSTTGTQLGICLQNRYNAPVVAARDLLASGRLGPVRAAHATVFWHRSAEYYRDRPWRGTWAQGGGGLLMNQAIHTIDLLIHLVGHIVDVRGGVATRALASAIEVEDTADAVFIHESGVTSTFFATLANAVNAPVTLDVVTDDAELSLRGALTVRHRDGRTEVVPERAAQRAGRAYWGASHELLIADFYEACRTASRFWIGAREAALSLDAIQRLYDRSGVPAR